MDKALPDSEMRKKVKPHRVMINLTQGQPLPGMKPFYRGSIPFRRTLSLDDIAESIFKQRTEYRKETLVTTYRLMNDAIYEAFGGKVAREKIDSFKAGYGTLLYFYDEDVVKGLQEQFPLYAANFPIWAQQANGMLQISIWTALRELNIGANLQNYNPVIDETVKKMFSVPDSWKLIAQMPFGGIAAEPQAKDKEDIKARVKVFG